MTFEQYKRDEEVDCCYGMETYFITEEDIEHLRNGGKLYSTINGGEYAIQIVME
jgi:hypothetical protein